jgi:hypothetical protein
MLAIDLALLVGGAVVVIVIASLIGGRVGARGEDRRRKQLGADNATDEKRRMEERCAICNEQVDPVKDVWDQEQWWHRTCYREALR